LGSLGWQTKRGAGRFGLDIPEYRINGIGKDRQIIILHLGYYSPAFNRFNILNLVLL